MVAVGPGYAVDSETHSRREVKWEKKIDLYGV